MRPTIAACLLLLPINALLADDAPSVLPGVEMNEKELAFQKMLTGVKLTGAFTVVGREAPAKEESYEIQRLGKVGGENWVILARAKWGKNDVTLPFPVRVVWADDTPMITLTEVGFPGLKGKFGCRVLFHGDRYAGTWQHDKVGGHMYGVVEKIAKAE